MSDEFEMTKAMGEATQAMKQNTLVNAAAVAQRQKESEQHEKAATDAIEFNFKLHALKVAVSLSQVHSDRTAERVMADADEFLAWLRGQKASDGGAT